MRRLEINSRSILWAMSSLLAVSLAASTARDSGAPTDHRLPWREAGLTARQAAAHLLDRFAFGARPGEVDRVAAMGPDEWFEHQLTADFPEARVPAKLAPLHSLGMSSDQYLSTYPPRAVIYREAVAAGVVEGKRGAGAKSVKGAETAGASDVTGLDRPEIREKLLEFARRKGYRTQREAIGELVSQKVYRAVYAENQLQEVMTDFWFNHFNVALTKNRSRPFVMSYERDAIRPNALGSFRGLLEATAKHPAMLLYLDNAESTANVGSHTAMARNVERQRDEGGMIGGFRRRRLDEGMRRVDAEQKARKKPQGVNENYARELMELHTLGVDGGYTQDDVIAVARAFTGWTVYPPGPLRKNVQTRVERAMRADVGFELQGDFLFRSDTHDADPKLVLGHTLAGGRGMADGEDVLDILAAHPATARLVARKLAVRFVADEPPQALVDRLAQTFTATHGDVKAVLRALAESSEFWAPAARRQKIKSPFEVASSSLRALGAEVTDPVDTVRWIARMGQQLYAYQAPTGWPDRAAQWVNSGALLNRMNFGLQLASGRVRGVTLDLARLDGGREPESREAALETYVPLLLPERDSGETVRLLTPMLRDPALADRVVGATPEVEVGGVGAMDEETAPYFGGGARQDENATDRRRDKKGGGKKDYFASLDRLDRNRPPLHLEPPTPLEQVVGLILGSPEFQRR